MKRTRQIEEMRWCNDLARALGMTLLVLMAGATFIGIAFQPWFWLQFATSFCLSEYVRRALTPEKPRPAFLPAVTRTPSSGPPPSGPPRGAQPAPSLSTRHRL